MWGYARVFLIVSLVGLLAGCGAHHSSVFRTYEVKDDKKVKTSVIDAKQRAILATSASDGESDVWPPKRDAFVCAEPSPDALSAISSTFSASFGGAFGPSETVQAALATGFQEAAGQLGLRNATIQLLRDGLYRQCEAYMNGLIDRVYYEQIANKYVNAMVTLLAIEEMTPSAARAVRITANEGSTVTAGTEISVGSSPPSEDPGNGEEDPENQDDNEDSDEPDESNGEDEGGSNQQGTARGNAQAGPPVVGVNLPNNSVPVEPHISAAVNAMVTAFLIKDTADNCLRTLARDELPSDPEVKTALVEICRDFIQNQAEQQETAAAAAFVASGGSIAADECSNALRSFWQPGGIFNTENQNRIEAEMRRLNIQGSLVRLINEIELAGDRIRVGSALGLPACM